MQSKSDYIVPGQNSRKNWRPIAVFIVMNEINWRATWKLLLTAIVRNIDWRCILSWLTSVYKVRKEVIHYEDSIQTKRGYDGSNASNLHWDCLDSSGSSFCERNCWNNPHDSQHSASRFRHYWILSQLCSIGNFHQTRK